MKLTVIGCGDAFSSGGRYQSCYLLDTKDGRILLECGANSPLAMKRAKIDVSMIDAVIITHCHGDHFGGLPFLYLNKLFLDNRDHVVDIFGPVGFKERLRDLMECFYAGILATPRRFSFRFHEIIPGSSSQWKCINILGFEVYHYSGTPALALRIEDGETMFCFFRR